MVIYGLRDHECWLCEIDPNPPYFCRVIAGKSGSRDGILPLYREWAEEWKPWAGELPFVKTDGLSPTRAHKLYGERTARQFRRLKVCAERTPYDYRHAYAIRSALVFGFDVAARARMMGHSASVHLERYNRYISQERMLTLYQEMEQAGYVAETTS